jgi:hypothetical protein
LAHAEPGESGSDADSEEAAADEESVSSKRRDRVRKADLELNECPGHIREHVLDTYLPAKMANYLVGNRVDRERRRDDAACRV